MQLTEPFFETKLVKIKKIHLKNVFFLFFRKFNFLYPKKSSQNLFKLSVSPKKNLTKLFYALNKAFRSLDKTPLGETGCLSNLY